MSITINGATNTLTAASGLTIAGNTAVTGTLSASGSISSTSNAGSTLNLTGAGANTPSHVLLRNTTAGGASPGVQFYNGDGYRHYFQEGIGTAGLNLVAVDGTPFNIATNTAVTGTLSATGVITKTNTAATLSNFFSTTGSTTEGAYARASNTSGTLQWGIEGAAGGGTLTGASAYSGFIGTVTNTDFHIQHNNTVVGTFSATALTLGSGVNLVVNSGNLSGGAPTYGGDIVLNQRGGASGINSAGGIEIKIDSSGSGYGARLFQWFDGVSGYNTSIQTRSNSATWSTALTIDRSNTSITPGTDNTISLGAASLGWKELFCDNGTINTSDARRKTEVSALSAAEINAAKQLGKEIGSFKFLAALDAKGDAARLHIGMTVQRAIEIMEANGLDPFAYSFICHDAWGDVFVDHPAVDAIAAQEAVLDEDGNVITPAVDAVEGQAAWTEQTQVAGDKYSFRVHELLLFMAAGFEARLSVLEAA